MDFLRRLFGKKRPAATPKEGGEISTSYRVITGFEALAKVRELGLIKPNIPGGAVIVRFSQKPEDKVGIEGVVKCVCGESLAFKQQTLSPELPILFGGLVTCKACGAEIGSYAELRNADFILVATVDVVHRRFAGLGVGLHVTNVIYPAKWPD